MEHTQRGDVSIQQIRIFLAAAQTGSFSQAAQKMYLTQPVVSKWIAKLERELGCKLFVRQGSGVKLTEEGETLVDGWKHLLNVYDDTLGALDRRSGKKRTLRVGILTQLRFVRSVAEIQQRFAEKHPDIDVVLEVYDFKELRYRLINGELDVAYLYSFDIQGEEDLQLLTIHQAELYLAGMPDALENPEAEGYHTLLLVSRSESRTGGDLVMKACRDMGFHFNSVQYYPNIASVELAARQGKGVMMVGKYAFQKNDPMLRFPVPKEYVNNDVAIAWAPAAENSSVVALIHCAEEYKLSK